MSLDQIKPFSFLKKIIIITKIIIMGPTKQFKQAARCLLLNYYFFSWISNTRSNTWRLWEMEYTKKLKNTVKNYQILYLCRRRKYLRIRSRVLEIFFWVYSIYFFYSKSFLYRNYNRHLHVCFFVNLYFLINC